MIGKTYLVGLDNNQNMANDYGLDASEIVVLPNGVQDIEKIVDDISKLLRFLFKNLNEIILRNFCV